MKNLIRALKIVSNQSSLTYEKWKAELGPEDFATFQESYGEGSDDYDDDDDDDEKEVDEYEKEVDEYVQDLFQEVVAELPTRFPLVVYRAICVKSYDDIDKNEIGVHWTTEKHSAKCYNSLIGTEFLFTAKVPSEVIDWVMTIYHRIEDRFQNYSESEINLLKGKKITASLEDENENDEFEATV